MGRGTRRVADDRELWNKLCRSDREAFERFYDQNFRPLRNFLWIYLRNQHAAEDVAQETFMELWKNPDGFSRWHSSLKAYVFGVARNRGADLWRSERRSSQAEMLQEPCAVGEETRLEVRDAMSQLEPELASLLWLRGVEGYSYEELSQIFDIPVGTVKSRLFAAREQLRGVWKGFNPGREHGMS
jgi:RNA polymerase sigma-70 factor (ECF subfamily)